jgi:hypothetical protein
MIDSGGEDAIKGVQNLHKSVKNIANSEWQVGASTAGIISVSQEATAIMHDENKHDK